MGLGKLLATVVLLAWGAFSSATGHAAIARSTNYSLDYALATSGGGSSQSAQYGVVSVLKAQGVTGETVTSTRYKIETVVGITDPPAASSVTDWSLY
jgi:hypothetical protein